MTQASNPPVGGQQTPNLFGRTVPLGIIKANRKTNVRRHTPTEEEVTNLGESLKAGQLQPCLGRLTTNGKGIELVAGFRRFEAAQKAGLTTLWVEEIKGDDVETCLVNLIENIAREDLTPAEKARGYLTAFDRMKEASPKIGNSKLDETIANRCGVSRPEVAQYRNFATRLSGKVMKAWQEFGSEIQTKWLQSIVSLEEGEQNKALADKLRVISQNDVPEDGTEDEETTASDKPKKDYPKTPSNPDAVPRVTKSKIETEFAALIANGMEYVGATVSDRVSPSKSITAEWVAGAIYAMGFSLGRHAFNPTNKTPEKKVKGKPGRPKKEKPEGVKTEGTEAPVNGAVTHETVEESAQVTT